MKRLKSILKELPDLLLGHKVIVSRATLGKAWRDQVKGYAITKEPDISGVNYDSAFNDMCKQIGLREGE